MNGGVTTATVTVSNMPTLTTGQKKMKRGTLTKSAKTKLVKRKQPKNGLNNKTVDVAKNVLCEQQPRQEDVLEEKGCALCKKRGEHELVDLRENLEMRKTFSKYLGVPLKNVEPALANICVQCVLKINMSTEITRNLTNCIRRVVNGQASNTTTNSTQISNDISPEKQTSTCLPKPSVQKNKKKISTHSSPTKSCSQSPKQKSATPTKPSNAPPDLSILQASRPNILKPAATSTPDCVLTPTFVITDTTSLHRRVIASLTETGHIKESCDVSLSPASSHIKPHHSNESKTNSNTLTDSTKKSSEVIVRVKREKFLQHQTVPVDLSKRNSSISINSPIPHGQESTIPPSASYLSVPLLTETTKDASIADSDALSAEQNHSMLEVYYERSESALITESGGKINKYVVERLPSQQLICPKCRTPYWHKFYFARHVRRCRARNAVSKESYAELTISNPTVDNSSAPSGAASKKRIFYCNECPVTLDSMKKLRDHKHIHLQRFYCETCGKASMARQDHEFHTVTCLAKQMASVTEQTQTNKPEKRMTRSMSHTASRAKKSLLSDGSNAVSENENDEEDDQFETVSIVDTMYTKRMRFTGHWIEEHSNSASNFSLCDDITFDFDDELLSDKEFDHYLLDKLKMQIHLNWLSCFVPGCDFHTDNLVLLIAHEYVDHKMRLWFHCKKCRCGFTSKVHLDYHLACQNGGRFICYKCGDIFEFQHLLDRHLIRHTKCIKHRCNYCNFEFLTENELLQHCDIEQHDANGARKLIRIDPTMTIVNRVPPARPSEGARYYNVRILEMKLPKMPTKRPRPMPGHLPYRLRVGEVLFENQKNPNCWGWK